MSTIVRISVLGPTQVHVGQRAVALRSLRQRRLIACLALHQPNAVSTDRLVEAIWGDRLPADPSAALQNQISRLRGSIGAAVPAIVTMPSGYGLCEEVLLDIADFGGRVALARSEPDAERQVNHFERALALWRGSAYEDLDVDDARAESSRLEELRLLAQEGLGAALVGGGRPGPAVALLERFCAEHPLREHARTVLAEGLLEMGRRGEALRTLNDLRRCLTVELGIDPPPAALRLEERILETQSGTRAPDTFTHAGPMLPVFGRALDAERVDERLRDARVVTLVGPGGVGKTTLAMVVVDRIRRRFEHGAVVVPLSGATVGDEVATVVAHSLRIDREAQEDWLERITESLIARDLLLVLDNAEHVVHATAKLVVTVAARTSCRILVTSREPLGISGEAVHRVDPLKVEADAENPAVALFADRAAALRPEWSLSEETMPVVADICRRLDGLPIAIELAVAQLRYRSLLELRHRSLRPLDLAGPKRAEPRHRRLRDVLDWSYELLDPTAKRVFDRLGLFLDGFTLEPVTLVCGDVVEPARFEGLLEELIDRSLVVREDRPYGTRYRLLELVRLYALEHLGAAPDYDSVADRYAAAIVVETELARQGVFGPAEPAWVARFDDARANVHAAYQRLMDRGRIDLCMRLASASYLVVFPRARGDLGELLSGVLAAVGGQWPQVAPSPLLVEMLGLGADAAVHAGDTTGAEALIARGVELRNLAPGADRFCSAAAGDAALIAGDPGRAAGLYEAAHAGFVFHGEAALAAWMQSTAALARSYQGHPDDQVGPALQALESAERTGSPSARAFARYVLAEVLADRDPAEARRQLQAAVSDAESVDAEFIAGLARLSLATAAARDGGPQAVEHFRVLVSLWLRAGRWAQQWITLRSLAVLLARRGLHAEATTLLGALARYDEHPPWGSDAILLSSAEAACRAALGPFGYDEAWTAGGSFGKAQVPAFADRVLQRLALLGPSDERP